MGQRDEGLLAHHLDILLLDVGVRPEQLSCEVLGAARPVDSAADASLLFANGLVMLGPPLPPLRSAHNNDQ